MDWRLGVAGSPISHSLSPQLHDAGLALAGLRGASRLYELGEGDAANLRGLMGTSVDAMSITMPLKSVAATLCDDLDDSAAALGIVNSLLWRDGRLRGAATDGPGFIDALHGVFGVRVEGLHVVVLGAGGAARAIVASLVHQGAQSVSLLGRSEANVAQIVNRYPRVMDHMALYRPVDVIVNTTPVPGRAPETSVMQGVSRETIAVDITYDPRTSPWLELHRRYGCPHTNGLAMLAYQAARQMNWWWGANIDGDELLQVIS